MKSLDRNCDFGSVCNVSECVEDEESERNGKMGETKLTIFLNSDHHFFTFGGRQTFCNDFSGASTRQIGIS